MRLARRAIARAIVVLAIAPGCDRSEPSDRGRVLAAVDALRDAESADVVRRRKLLEALERVPASEASATKTRDACVSAYRSLLDANDRAAAIGRALRREGVPPAAAAVQLRAAEDDITRARAAMPECERALDELRHPRSG